MAERAAVQVQPITRDRLRQFLGDRPELIRAFEHLFLDVGQTLPEATLESAQAAEVAQAAAESSQFDAETARALAAVALDLARRALTTADEAQQMLAELSQHRATIAALSRRIDSLENTP